MILDESWFTEISGKTHSAFSLKVRARLHAEQSPFQRIEVYDTFGFGRLLVIDGIAMLSDRDNFLYHEMLAHPALFTHPAPRRVLIVGGGDCGTLREVLKHVEVEHVVQVEIDEAVTRVARDYFPALTESNDDPRAEFRFEDGIDWVRRAGDASYDVIIVDSTDPIGPAVGLFNEAFVRDCHRALDEDGVLVQQSESPLFDLEEILKPVQRNMWNAGFEDVRALHFPQPVYPSGWWTASLARKRGSVESFRTVTRSGQGPKTRYYNAAVHRGALATPEFMKNALADSD